MSQAFKRQYRVEDDTLSQHQVGHSWSPSGTPASDACIIQCPSCQTRFSLPLNALDGQTDPRFHCSQCDTIFRVEAEEQRPTPTLVETPVAAPAMDPIEDQMMMGTAYETVQNIAAPTYNPIVTEEQPIPEPQLVISEEPTKATPQPIQSKSFEIPKSISSSWSLGAPHESAQRETDLTSVDPAIKSSFASRAKEVDPPVTPKITTVAQMSLDLESPAKKLSSQELTFGRPTKEVKVELSEHDPLKTSVIETFPNRKTIRKQKPTAKQQPSKPKKGEVSIQKRQLLLESVKRLKISIPLGRWQAPLMIAGPLLTFCGALFFLSIFLKADPLHSEELITSVVPGLPRVPPPGLAVIEARLRKLTLDSGDTIFALSGTVKNNSGKQLNQIQLDGLVFDKTGNMINEKQVIVSSPLSQSKIKSLTLEMIEDIEANASKGRTAVKDGESAPFVVTFLPSEVAGARYFSTRINSIK